VCLYQDEVRIYPGADEVGLTLLARFSVDVLDIHPSLLLIFRNTSTINLIPNFEGQPMINTLLDQLSAAGGVAINTNTSAGISSDAVLLVDNFDTFPQLDASKQPTTGGSVEDYASFTTHICPFNANTTVVGFADNRYSNGADMMFLEYMDMLAETPDCALDMAGFAYAGWNTNGNTLGTVISNTVLLVLFGKGGGITSNNSPTSAQIANTYFNTLRIVEDGYYQAKYRQVLIDYVNLAPNDTMLTLYNDLEFYDAFTYKLLWGATSKVTQVYNLPWFLSSVYYPWNRTFEIGMLLGQQRG
jgi:hypothetical protein